MAIWTMFTLWPKTCMSSAPLEFAILLNGLLMKMAIAVVLLVHGQCVH